MKAAKYIFLAIGAIILTASYFYYIPVHQFLQNAKLTEGIVVDNITVTSSSSAGSSSSSCTYAPLVQFRYSNGELHSFVSSISSSPPSYDIGEKVEVLYNPEAPEHNCINGFFTIWEDVFIPSLMGTVFFTVGAIFLFFEKRKAYREWYLKKYGITIQADINSVELDETYSVDDENPYQIIAHYFHPKTLEPYFFISDAIWFNPTKYIKTTKVNVIVNEKNYKRYKLDLSEIYKLAKQEGEIES